MTALAKATITLIDQIPARRRPPPRQANADQAGGRGGNPGAAAPATPAPTTTPAPAATPSAPGTPAPTTRPPRQPTRFEPLQTITLHFNPESLEFKIENRTETKKKRTNQRVQYTGESSTTLSFECIFDATRPGAPPVDLTPPPRGSTDLPQALDVRIQTRVLAGLLNIAERDGASEQMLFPKLVRFDWGTVTFTGYVSSFSEVLEYFSPEGVPLRSKVNVTLTEQSHRYHVSGRQQKAAAAEDARREGEPRDRATDAAPSGDPAPAVEPLDHALESLGASIDQAKSVARQSGLADLFELADGLPLTFGGSLGGGFGVELDFDLRVGADIDIDIDAGQLEALFGDGAHRAARGAERKEQGAAVRPGGTTRRDLPAPVAGTDWAPDGPRPGTEAAALAGTVLRDRLRGEGGARVGGDFRAEGLQLPATPTVPPPLRGSPPLRRTLRPDARPGWASDRPRWEGAPEPLLDHDDRCRCRACTSGGA